MRKPREATGGDAGFRRLFEAIGAHASPQRENHERDRARQRAVVGIALPIFWLVKLLLGLSIGPPLWFVALGLAYGIASLAYLRFLERLDGSAAVLLYAFLLLDPIFLVGILFFDPETFAFLNPFLLVVIVRHRHPLRNPDDVPLVGYDAGGVPVAPRKRLLAVERRARPGVPSDGGSRPGVLLVPHPPCPCHQSDRGGARGRDREPRTRHRPQRLPRQGQPRAPLPAPGHRLRARRDRDAPCARLRRATRS